VPNRVKEKEKPASEMETTPKSISAAFSSKDPSFS
jgi:hypothetical protein